MSDTDHIDEDEVLRRMLATPHEKHKPLNKKGRAEARPNRSHEEDQKRPS